MLKFGKVGMQMDGSDCGEYTIAFATALCLGTCPVKLYFDKNKMHPDLIYCLDKHGYFNALNVWTLRQHPQES